MNAVDVKSQVLANWEQRVQAHWQPRQWLDTGDDDRHQIGYRHHMMWIRGASQPRPMPLEGIEERLWFWIRNHRRVITSTVFREREDKMYLILRMADEVKTYEVRSGDWKWRHPDDAPVNMTVTVMSKSGKVGRAKLAPHNAWFWMDDDPPKAWKHRIHYMDAWPIAWTWAMSDREQDHGF